ncbi:hypothetical protein GJ496_000224 [Pomphorhynchus laevis]|nr:hypothetical protein GJ496_000224 [Pomphorhynchus laevis]
MKEVINVHLGQAGCQISQAVWELYCYEHGISPSGRPNPSCCIVDSSFSTHFFQTQYDKFVPRAIFVDTEPTVIDEIRSGTYRSLFNTDCLLSGHEDAASNYARAYFNSGPILIDRTLEQIRKLSELSDQLQGFFVFHSFGGGTGSGLGSLLLEALVDNYKPTTRMELAIYPSPRLSPIIVEPYNTLLNTHATLDCSDVVFIMDNEALWDIIRRHLNVERPTFTNINRVCAQVVSSITAGLRFTGQPSVDLIEFQTNLVPYPRIHFPLVSFAPFVSSEKAINQRMSTADITSDVFSLNHQLLKVDPSRGKYMVVSLLYRGNVSPQETNMAVGSLKNRRGINWVDWMSTGFKIGINYRGPSRIPGGDLAPVERNVCMLSNNTAIGQAWSLMNKKFDILFKRKAFLHWYLAEGMTENDFLECQSNLRQLEQDYEDAANGSERNVPS